MTKTNEMNRHLAKLRYSLGRYQAAGNGFMCQQLSTQIRRMIAGDLNLSSAKN
ncbi:hypothetical protein [Parabacteroides sp. Marseille-P3160]|uniref:hypothetical protein n=1 Tax=Parabacteroides sp. Marseille-P3160 TaxID=1917887 RepID=UPI00135734B7|nr:hypothetical protein [Parabacteroides sp. Marseille-P3160]